jgi:hypothetical protein
MDPAIESRDEVTASRAVDPGREHSFLYLGAGKHWPTGLTPSDPALRKHADIKTVHLDIDPAPHYIAITLKYFHSGNMQNKRKGPPLL